jgi:hypothetical protein
MHLTSLARLPHHAGEKVPESPTSEQVLQWVLATCLAVAEAPAPLMALRLLLASAQVASEAAGLELLAYELFERCFLLYEESVADQRHKVVALQGILGALHRWGEGAGCGGRAGVVRVMACRAAMAT